MYINLLAIGFIAISISPYYFPSINKKNAPSTSMRICSLNLDRSNSQIEKLSSLVKNESPDVLLLMEVTPKWERLISSSTIRKTYPYMKVESRIGYYGIAIYSKYPLKNIQTKKHGIHKLPSLHADVSYNNKTLHVIGTHPPPPVNKEHFNWRNDQYKNLNTAIQQEESPMVVMGDLNCTSHSCNFKRLTKQTSLRDSRLGKGLQASWSIYNKSILPLSLDHIFVSDDIYVSKRYLAKNVGSDHLPVIADIRF